MSTDCPHVPLHTLVERQAAERAHAHAIVSPGCSLTYSELNAWANRMARGLEHAGLRPGDRVGIHLGRRLDTVAAMLAAGKLGAAFAALDAERPPAHIQERCRDAGLRTIVTTKEHAGLFRAALPGTSVLDADDVELNRRAGHNLERAVPIDAVAQVLEVNDVAGNARAVLLPHRSIGGEVFGVERVALGERDAYLQWSSWSAIAPELWLVFRAGATCVWHPDEAPTPEGLAAAIAGFGVTSLMLGSPLFGVMLDAFPEALARLRCVMVRSDAGSTTRLSEGRRKLPATMLVHAYGPDECGSVSASYALPRDLAPNIERVPIGAAAGERRTYVLNRALQPLPAGQVGQMHIGGPDLGHGYLNRPDLTAGRFLPDPFSREPGSRMFATGDLTRRRHDGELELLGRSDRQAGLRSQPAGQSPLPAPDTQPTAGASRRPMTRAEEVLVAVWREVLRREVGLDDSFFALGGDSILSIQIVARARQRGVRLTPRDMFEHETIAQIAAFVETRQQAHAEQGAVEGVADLTPIQRSFFARPLSPRSHFNQSVVLMAREPLRMPALAAAVAALLRQHDALRLRFAETAAGWRQWNLPDEPRRVLGCVDLTIVAAAARTRVWQAVVERLQRSLSLEAGPLARVMAVRLWPEAGERLVMAVHHLAVDGVSWRVLLEDLERAYGQARREEAVTLGPKTSSFRAWAAALNAYMAGGALDRAYWMEVLSRGDAGPAVAPGRVGEARRAQIAATPAETQALVEGVARRWGSSTEAALLSALGEALRRWTGAPAHLVDVEGHGRQPEAVGSTLDLSRTVGWFTTVYPVRVAGRDEGGWAAALQRQHSALRTIPHRGLGYGLLRWSGAAADAWPAPQVGFNYLGQWDQALPPSGAFGPATEPRGAVCSPDAARLHAIEVTAQVWQDVLRLQIQYAPAVETGIAVFIEALHGALGEIAAACTSAAPAGVSAEDFAAVVADLGEPPRAAAHAAAPR